MWPCVRSPVARRQHAITESCRQCVSARLLGGFVVHFLLRVALVSLCGDCQALAQTETPEWDVLPTGSAFPAYPQGHPWQHGKDTIEDQAAQGILHKDCGSDSVLKYLLSVVHKKKKRQGLRRWLFQVAKSFTWETKPSEKLRFKYQPVLHARVKSCSFLRIIFFYQPVQTR